MNDMKEGLTPLDARQCGDVAGSVVPVKGAVGFTPGPWEVGTDDEFNGCEFIPILAERAVVAEVQPDYNDEDGLHMSPISRANARLIAAAPDLFDALAELLFEDSNKGEIARIITRCKARNALMKASEAPLRGSVPDPPAPPEESPAPTTDAGLLDSTAIGPPTS